MKNLKVWSKPQIEVSPIKSAQAGGRNAIDNGTTHHS
jgi:hypothetical protein